MKRMKPEERTFKADRIVDKLWKGLTCTAGAWNRDKIALLVANRLKRKVALAKPVKTATPKKKKRRPPCPSPGH